MADLEKYPKLMSDEELLEACQEALDEVNLVPISRTLALFEEKKNRGLNE